MAKPFWTETLFKFALFLTLLTTLSLTTLSVANAEESLSALTPYKITYEVIHDGDDVGVASRDLVELSNGQWQLSMESDISYYFLSDKRQETSRFEVVDGLIRPLVYQRNSETSMRSDTTLLQNFDWNNNLEQGTYKDDKWTQPLRPGYLDQLTQITLIREHLMNQIPVPAIDISYRGTIRHHKFKVLGQETIQTGKGPVNTAKVQLDEDQRERQTNFWFALEHDMIPVQIQRIKEGEEQAKLIATDW